MLVTLAVTTGPLVGRTFPFEGHDVFLVGRSPNAHCRFPEDDPYFSRVHFLVEVNPPRCRLTDMGSRNGTYVNGRKVDVVDLADGDEIRAGHTRFTVRVEAVPPRPKPAAGEPADTLSDVGVPLRWESSQTSARPNSREGTSHSFPVTGSSENSAAGAWARCILPIASRTGGRSR
jgi:pSer/pThr/pTyr-binding forkhead associated (FHA) protein